MSRPLLRASRKLGPRLARRLGRRRAGAPPPTAATVWRSAWSPLALAIAAGLIVWLESSGYWSSMRSAIESLDFDPSRSALILAWLGGGALAAVATALSGRPWVSTLSATIFVAVTYVWPFGERIRQQVPEIFGLKEALQPTVLWHNQAVALGVTLAVALVAAATADLVRRGILGFLVSTWTLARSPRIGLRPLLGLAAAGAIGVTSAAGLVLAAGVDPVLRYGPEHGVYLAPVVSQRPLPADPRLPGAPPEPIPAQGRLIEGVYHSASMAEDRQFLVYLPPTYGLKRALNRHYPVLYLLHGDPGNPWEWVQFGATGVLDTGISTGAIPETIVIFPDGNGHVTAATQWANRFDGRDRVEDALLELVDQVDFQFRTVPDRSHRLIGGLSSGGFGATNIAARHPAVFSVAMSFSGYFTATGPVFGGISSYVRNNSPYYLVENDPSARTVDYVLVVGNRDPYYLQANWAFAAQLNRLGVPHDLSVLSGGHSADIWQSGLELGMTRMAQRLAGVTRQSEGGGTHGIQF